MHQHREVRVTARESIRNDFIAPELSPVRLVDSEAEKGTKGWTDMDVKVPDLKGRHLPKGHAKRDLEALRVGALIPKTWPETSSRVASRYANGPSAELKEARLAATRISCA